ncbi:hypothetical protein RND71_018469 [Anisodus tanguticus]|uniref:Uncharacterized protein n=1 Tax=Anisodus tanguticus TaxID=243964 RepID=A0AAE1S5R4_9SOLA|nr:hypothetical protein RND71_018469 [Anisodus tanguticus]
MIVLIDKLWDDILDGPHPDKGLGKFQRGLTFRTAIVCTMENRILQMLGHFDGAFQTALSLKYRNCSKVLILHSPLLVNKIVTQAYRHTNNTHETQLN